MGKVRDWVKTSVEDKFRKLCTETVVRVKREGGGYRSCLDAREKGGKVVRLDESVSSRLIRRF